MALHHILVSTNIPQGKRGAKFVVKLCDLDAASRPGELVSGEGVFVVTHQMVVDMGKFGAFFGMTFLLFLMSFQFC